MWQDWVPIVEWWPDYAEQIFFLRRGRGGVPATLESLGLSPSLSEALRCWVKLYGDQKLPHADGHGGDPVWMSEGVALLARTRSETAGRFLIVVTEPFWGESVSG